MKYRNYLLTANSVVVYFDDGSTKSVPVENVLYYKVRSALEDHRFDEVPGLVDMAVAIRRHSSGKFYVVNGLVMIDEEILPDSLSARLIQFVEQGIDTTALERFWLNLKHNPSLRSRTMLYAFLDHNGIPLTADGCFIAYKRVTEDFKDCHTRTFDNSIGVVVEMRRKDVDDDPSVTCSRGLHVAAFPYAKDFYANGRLVEVKVNPMDVVAVPDDYNGQKMRVCKYVVMRECEGPRPDKEVVYKYDDTADMDNYNDYYDDDDYADDDYDDYGVDYDDGWGDSVELDKKDSMATPATYNAQYESITVNVDGRGRVCIPAKLLRSIGARPFDVVYVMPDGNDLRVTKDKAKKDQNTRSYTVDRDCNVRISSYVLALVGLNNFHKVKLTLYNGDIVIS